MYRLERVDAEKYDIICARVNITSAWRTTITGENSYGKIGEGKGGVRGANEVEWSTRGSFVNIESRCTVLCVAAGGPERACNARQ